MSIGSPIIADGRLVSLANFKPLKELDIHQLNCKGLYALRINDISSLPKMLAEEIDSFESTLIYIGISEKQTLNERIDQECFGKGHGTFFRGVGALLEYLPRHCSANTKKAAKNYRFGKEDTQGIQQWMLNYLLINWIEFNGNLKNIEKELVKRHTPILNSTHNPKKSAILKEARKRCRDYAYCQNNV